MSTIKTNQHCSQVTLHIVEEHGKVVVDCYEFVVDMSFVRHAFQASLSVSLQVIGSGESKVAAFEMTDVRLFVCVLALAYLQVSGALNVAAGDREAVCCHVNKLTSFASWFCF